MAQHVKTLATKTDNLSSDPGTHMGKGKNHSSKLSSAIFMCAVAPTHPYTDKIK